MKVPDLNDPQYRQRFLAGDVQVAEEVFNYYTLYVSNRLCQDGCSRDVAEDITQETVTAVYKAIRSALTKGSPLTFNSQADFEGYLMTAAFNKKRDYGKQTRDQREFEVPLDERDENRGLEEKRAGGASPASSKSQDFMEILRSNPRYRAAFDLLIQLYQDIIAETVGRFSKLYPGVPYDAKYMVEQYARSTGETVSAVRKRYYRALKRLKANFLAQEISKTTIKGDKVST
jgi:DNA-directed RNA polymerase specialized sigma24 family protein